MSYARTRYGGVTRFGVANPGCCDGGTAPDICCGGVTQYRSLRGDDDSVTDTAKPVLRTATAVAMTYHGYKRTGSLLWALVYGLAGKTVPLVAVPVAIAQGFGKPKPGCA